MTALAAPTPPSVPTDLPDQRRAVAALVALAVSAFAMVTTELLPGGVLTFVAADLGRSTAQIGLLVTAYAAVVVIASVPLTRLTASWPRRPLLAGTVLLAAAGLAGSAVAPTYEMLFVARVATALAQAVF
ncbi:MAG: MFS transporter, partial [Nocardioides sp.]|nr:MFS transporter [Nocardioides sp.]